MHLFKTFLEFKKCKGEITLLFNEMLGIYPYTLFHVITEV